MFAVPTYRADRESLTDPPVDEYLCKIHDSLILSQSVDLVDVFAASRILLEANYDVSLEELEELLIVDEGPEAREFADQVITVLFGDRDQSRSYIDWLRVNLLAGGFVGTEIGGSVLPRLLSLLATQNRLMPANVFIDSCIQAEEATVVDHLL